MLIASLTHGQASLPVMQWKTLVHVQQQLKQQYKVQLLKQKFEKLGTVITLGNCKITSVSANIQMFRGNWWGESIAYKQWMAMMPD